VSLLLVLLAALVFAPSARADSQARIVRLSLVDGPVKIDRGQGFEKAITNMPITQGMKLSTAADARAEVEFEDGTTLRLAPRTDVEFPILGLRSSGARFTTVLVTQGTAYFTSFASPSPTVKSTPTATSTSASILPAAIPNWRCSRATWISRTRKRT
jgi:hypothetical protein